MKEKINLKNVSSVKVQGETLNERVFWLDKTSHPKWMFWKTNVPEDGFYWYEYTIGGRVLSKVDLSSYTDLFAFGKDVFRKPKVSFVLTGRPWYTEKHIYFDTYEEATTYAKQLTNNRDWIEVHY